MATLLNGNDTNRLVEVLAGSTAFLSDPSGTGAAPLSLNSLIADETGTVLPDAAAADNAATSLAAPLDPVTTLLSDATGAVDGALAGIDTSDLLGVSDVLNLGTTSQLDVAGPEGAAQPVFDATNGLVKDVHAQLEVLVDEVGVPALGHAITGLGETAGLGTTGAVLPAADGHTNLVTDVVNAPATLLNGGLDDVITQVGSDLGDTLHAATGVVDALLNGGDALNPLPELISGLGADLQTLPLLNINGGSSAGDGGLLGEGALGGGLLNGVAGDLTGSSTGHLIDIDLGPQDSGGLGLDLLASSATDPTHTASINVIDVGPDGPNLLDLGLLTGADAASTPGLGGLGGLGSLGGLGNLGGLGTGGSGGLLSAEGGLLNGVVANLDGSSTGHLVDVDAGQQDANGLGLDLLSMPGADATHTASVNAVDVGPNGPQLLDLGVLTGSGIIDVPGLGGAGTDGLAGHPLDVAALLGGGLLNGDIASGNSGTAPVSAPLDLTALNDLVAAPGTGDHGVLDLHGAHIL